MSQELIPLEIVKPPKVPTTWDYDASVKKVKPMVYKWKGLTAEMISDLFIAREKLSVTPEDRERDASGTFVPVDKTWDSYCQEVGLERRTVNRWLDRCFPSNTPDLPTQPLPKGKFQVLYADPPWKYGQDQHSKEEQETVLSTHYPPMETEEICALPVKDLGYPNSVLFMWTTSPKLYECKQVIDAWGYEYKAGMVWDKVKHNVGYYVSVRHELLLICTRGSCLPDNPKLHDSVVTVERTEHSRKPEVFYEIIEDIYKGKKIELFARKARKGWTAWGNQLTTT